MTSFFIRRNQNILNQANITQFQSELTNYIQKFYKKRLTKIKFPKYLLFSFADSAYNHLSKILRDTINDIVPIHGTRIKGNTKPRFDSNVIELIRKRVILKESFLLIKLDIDYKQTILRNNCRKILATGNFWKHWKTWICHAKFPISQKFVSKKITSFNSMYIKMPMPPKISPST